MNLSCSSINPSVGMAVLLMDAQGTLLSHHPEWEAALKASIETLSLKKGMFYYIQLSKDQKVLLLCISDTPKTKIQAQEAGGLLFLALSHLAPGNISVLCDAFSAEIVCDIALGLLLRSWKFDCYHTSFRPLPKSPAHTIVFIHPEAQACTQSFKENECLADCIGWTRTLINQPGNILFPKSFIEHLQPLTQHGISLDILNQEDLRNMGAGALLGVAQGSGHKPYIAILRWQGGKPKEPPLAFVGKGVTFDSGGLSLKPSKDMGDMKMDMAGAAVVSGLLRHLSHRQARVNAIGVIALVENMPSGEAQRPGDIVQSLSGQTIEVLDTDAEGRLILADALWLTQERFQPRAMVDLATLTGAVRIALGPEFAGLFSNSEALAATLLSCGETVGEKLWRLPLCEAYDNMMNGTFSDLANIAPAGYGAGSSTAAQFLQRFVHKTPWAHLDIASTSCQSKDSALFSKGGLAFGLRLLDHWVKTVYEKESD